MDKILKTFNIDCRKIFQGCERKCWDFENWRGCGKTSIRNLPTSAVLTCKRTYKNSVEFRSTDWLLKNSSDADYTFKKTFLKCAVEGNSASRVFSCRFHIIQSNPKLGKYAPMPTLPGSSASSVTSYVGSGGRNASLAAILEGQGGQQKRQHSSEKDRPMPDILAQEKAWNKSRDWFSGESASYTVGSREGLPPTLKTASVAAKTLCW